MDVPQTNSLASTKDDVIILINEPTTSVQAYHNIPQIDFNFPSSFRSLLHTTEDGGFNPWLEV